MPKKREVRETRASYAAKRKKYTVKIDPAQLLREPIILKRNGKPIAAAVSIEDYRAFAEWKEQREPGEDFPPEWYQEKAAFQKLLPELLKTHREKWVAIYRGQIADSDDKPGELMYRVELKYGDEPVYVDEVLEEPRVYRIPSMGKVNE